jgi:hypothetical protein
MRVDRQLALMVAHASEAVHERVPDTAATRRGHRRPCPRDIAEIHQPREAEVIKRAGLVTELGRDDALDAG